MISPDSESQEDSDDWMIVWKWGGCQDDSSSFCPKTSLSSNTSYWCLSSKHRWGVRHNPTGR